MDDNEISGDLTLRSQGHSVNLPDIPRPVISALHEAAIGAKDHVESYQYRAIALEIEDIRQVSQMLGQWTRQYDIQSQIVQITAEHRHAGSGALTSRNAFKSLDEFLKYDDSNIDPVRKLTVRFSFILKNPNTQGLESYEITLEFPEAVDWRPDLLVGESKDPYEFRYRDDDGWTLKIRIEYTDYVTAMSLKSMVENWYKTLNGKGREWTVLKFSFLEKLLRYSWYDAFSSGHVIARWFPPILSFLCISALSGTDLVGSLGTVPLGISLLGSFLGVYFAADVAVRKAISSSDRRGGNASKTPLLLLNAGNRKIYEEEREAIKTSNRKRKSISRFFFVSVGLSLLLSIVANLITHAII